MDALKVTFEFTTLHCTDEEDGSGAAEPYLWTAFFKVDGETVVFDRSTKRLKGRATVVGTPGNVGNLGVSQMDDGQTVNVPSRIGRFETWLRPITVEGSDEVHQGGFMGCIAFLRESDETFGPTLELGHAALNDSLRHHLSALIPALGQEGHRNLSGSDQLQLLAAVGLAVFETMARNTAWDTEFGNCVFGNCEDDTPGTSIFHFSHGDLEPSLQQSIPFSRTFRRDGEWTLRGKVSVGRREYDAVWRPATEDERAAFGVKFGDFEAEYVRLLEKDFRLHVFNTYHEAGHRRYDAVWRRGKAEERHVFGMRLDPFKEKFGDLKKKGFRVRRFNTYEEDGHRHYDALWSPGDGDERFSFGETPSEFLDRYEDMKKDFRLQLFNTYLEDGQRKYDAIWRKGPEHEHFLFGKGREEFSERYQDLFAKGYRLHAFNTYVDDGRVRHDATWRRGDGGERALLALGRSAYGKEYDAVRDHMRIDLLNTYHVDA